MNIFKELGFTGREAELLHDNAELRITVEQQAAEIERLESSTGCWFQRKTLRLRSYWLEQLTIAHITQQAAEIERLKAEIEGIYEDSAGEDI
jgi:uncharacterized protein YqfB (UPF0267 family)